MISPNRVIIMDVLTGKVLASIGDPGPHVRCDMVPCTPSRWIVWFFIPKTIKDTGVGGTTIDCDPDQAYEWIDEDSGSSIVFEVALTADSKPISYLLKTSEDYLQREYLPQTTIDRIDVDSDYRPQCSHPIQSDLIQDVLSQTIQNPVAAMLTWRHMLVRIDRDNVLMAIHTDTRRIYRYRPKGSSYPSLICALQIYRLHAVIFEGGFMMRAMISHPSKGYIVIPCDIHPRWIKYMRIKGIWTKHRSQGSTHLFLFNESDPWADIACIKPIYIV